MIREGSNDIPLGERILFFIDSSHVTRPGGDVPYLYNTIIPALPSGSLVHVHDIFIPYDYTYQYQQRLYSEQHMLQALLCNSSKYWARFATTL